jgi:hypothetical protein
MTAAGLRGATPTQKRMWLMDRGWDRGRNQTANEAR